MEFGTHPVSRRLPAQFLEQAGGLRNVGEVASNVQTAQAYGVSYVVETE
ncbi:Uncharacterised protein [Mycobacteroides abscessus]|nr:Uncharacterised protein [Mycobacteroides abscessus]